MSNVYTTDTESSLIIYYYKQYIYLRSTTGENLNRSILLAHDYRASLSETIYQDTIYYAYQNDKEDIVIKSLLDTSPLFQLYAKDVGECMTPQIVAYQGKLLLFYVLKNPLNDTYMVKGMLPFENALPIETELYQSLPTVKLFKTKNQLFVSIENEEVQDFYLVGENFVLTKFETIGSDEMTQTKNLIATLQTRITELEGFVAELEQNATTLQNNASSVQMKLQEKDMLIERIKNQYDELMDTAMKYREEAQKWYRKFSTK